MHFFVGIAYEAQKLVSAKTEKHDKKLLSLCTVVGCLIITFKDQRVIWNSF